MRCIYCGVAEQTNDHSCVGCGAPKSESPEGLMWPYRLPRDEAEKAQLDAERLRNDVRLQFRRMKEAENATGEDGGHLNLTLCLLIVLFVLPFLMQMASFAFVRSIF